MGCGSSSLKGDKVADINDQAPQPIKKVRTNFSEVDFTGESGHRRGTVAVAPDEQRRPTKISETAETGGIVPTSPDPIPEEPNEQAVNNTVPPTEPNPVKSSIENPGLQFSNDPTTTADTATAGTASASATATAPGTTTNTQSPDIIGLSTPPSDDKPRRKSWLARFTESRKDNSTVISDEELKKQTGMTRAEFDVWKNDPKNKVGKHQMANDGLSHGDVSG